MVSVSCGPGGDGQGGRSRQSQPNTFWTFPWENPTPVENWVRYALGCKKAENPEIFAFAFDLIGFPDSSVGKEYVCNAGDPSLIPGLGSSPGEGIGYPLQYLWASLVAQTVKNLPAMWETWIWSLGWEDPLEEESMATHSSILAWRIPMDRGAWQAMVHGVTKCEIRLSD